MRSKRHRLKEMNRNWEESEGKERNRVESEGKESKFEAKLSRSEVYFLWDARGRGILGV